MHKKRTNRTRAQSVNNATVLAWSHYPVNHEQLVLFAMAHDFSRGRTIFSKPRDAALAAAIDDHIIQHGIDARWTRVYANDVRSGVRLLLGTQDTPGAAVFATAVSELTAFRLPVRSICEVLDSVGMLDNNRPPAIHAWFEHQVEGLPDQMVAELRTWFDVMLNGSSVSPRSRPRSIITIQLYLRRVIDPMHRFADNDHQSLREITRSDVIDALPPPGIKRSQIGQAMRSVFGTLKGHKAIFTNPTSRLQTWSESNKPPESIDLPTLQAALNATDPARALLSALAAYHGLKTGDLRKLKNVDLADGHLRLADRRIPIAAAVSNRLERWLNHRNQQWPHSTNPHVFIHTRTAKREEPVGARWISLTLDIPGGVQAIRNDRILHEAIATNGDVRQLCDLFGLSIQHASRYAHAVHEPPDPD